MCPLAESGGFREYHCYGLRAWHRNATHANRICRAQRRAMRAPAARSWFGALGCNAIAGHYDMAVYAALDEGVRARTLVVATLREPLDLALSLFFYLPRAPEILGPTDEVRARRGAGFEAARGSLWAPPLPLY